MIRALFVGLFFLCFFTFFIPVLLALFIVKQFNERAALKAAYAVVKVFLRFELFVAGTTLIVEGRDNIPDDEAVLFVGNHRSYFDALATYVSMKQPTAFIAKIQLSKIPVMGQWMHMIGCLFMNRENVREGLKTINAAAEDIRQGIPVFIFPEGTRNRNEDQDIPMDFKEGSLKIAQKTNCSIIPVAIKDTEKIYEAHKPKIRVTRETVRVRFMEPVSYKDIPEEYKKTPAAYIRELILEANKEPIKKI
ncbi:MAG: lysophospholipid acyltransferase family protein [Eubacteriales bacterium]|nr:lysophospholipid acyltransferase family protein [Eubacteriales bacterium]